MATKTKQAKILTVEEWQTIKRPLPKSLLQAAGMMRHKRKALERHLKQVRNEWDRHLRT